MLLLCLDIWVMTLKFKQQNLKNRDLKIQDLKIRDPIPKNMIFEIIVIQNHCYDCDCHQKCNDADHLEDTLATSHSSRIVIVTVNVIGIKMLFGANAIWSETRSSTHG